MLLTLHQNAFQNNDIKIVNRSFGNVAQFTIRNDINKSGFD
jgi:hypothetical protein